MRWMISYAEADERIRDMKKEGARFIVVNLHWGTEYQLKESEQQREIAQKLCDLGVDALIGGHPHCLQPIDVFQSADGKKQMFCIFSVGNGLSNQRTYLMDEMPTGHTEDGVMVTLSLHQNTNGTVDISGIDLLPTCGYTGSRIMDRSIISFRWMMWIPFQRRPGSPILETSWRLPMSGRWMC